MIEKPYYPIIYVRGYAGTKGEIEDTVSTPYMGFNRGSTRLRQLHTGEVEPHVFESPLIRLMKDHGYVDAYREGQLLPQGPIPSRSIWIFRYYDIADEEFGEGERKEIEFYAEKLREFLGHVRDAVLDRNESPKRFRVYLVAHSMGGLICRCYLQNTKISDLEDNGEAAGDWHKKGVDKLFTYGTPHGGIEFRRGMGWVEGLRDFFDPNNAGNFGPKRMREFLDLPEEVPLNSLDSCDPEERGFCPEERVFCLVGTDSRDYGAAGGLARRAVGEMSDGLVQIKNASVLGAARAFVHRSHSGHYGLVNSESGYQNLRRFLFGDARVLVEMTDVSVSLPAKVDKEKDRGKEIRASYHIDTAFSVRGVPVELNRRSYDEASAIFRSYDQLTRENTKLFTAFLMQNARVNRRRRSLGFALRLQVRVPRYEVDKRTFDDYYEGGILFVDKLNVEVTPRVDGTSRVRYGWDNRTPDRTSRVLQLESNGDALIGTVPFGDGRNKYPGIRGKICFNIKRWNK